MLARLAILVFVVGIACRDSVPVQYNCSKVYNTYKPRTVQINIPTAPLNNSRILLYCTDDPSRAAASLFATIIHDALGYERVTVRRGKRLLRDLVRNRKLTPYPDISKDWHKYREIALILSTAWEPFPAKITVEDNELKWGLAGARLQEFGSSELPSRLQLHVYLPEEFQSKHGCLDILRQWSSYGNLSALSLCGFDNASLSNYLVAVCGLNPDKKDMTGVLSANDEFILPRFRFERLSQRKDLLQKLDMTNQSFLFIDYEMWSGYPNVCKVNLPPCVPRMNTKCLLEQDTTIAMRIGDVPVLKYYAPRLLDLAHNFKPSHESIRQILQIEADLPISKNKWNNDEAISKLSRKAACMWSEKHEKEVDKYVQSYSNNKTYEMLIFHCSDDLDYKEYDKFVDVLQIYVDQLTRKANFFIKLTKYDANCNDTNYLMDKLYTHLKNELIGELVAAVIGGLKGIRKAKEIFAWANLPTIIYKEDFFNETSPELTWLSTRRSHPLAIAFNKFIFSMKWSRVAVISEDTEAAKDFLNKLVDLSDIVHHNYVTPFNITSLDAANVLREIQTAGAHIVLVNAKSEDAGIILSAAQRFGMNSPEEYAWIVRERLPNNSTLNITHFTISSFCQSSKDVPDTNGRPDLRNEMDKLWFNRTWPEHAMALADAVLTIVDSYKSVILKYPYLRDDIRKRSFIKLLENSIRQEPIKGVMQTLTYKGSMLEESLVFIDEWPDHQYKYKAIWRVNTSSRTVRVEYDQYSPYFRSTPPEDGSSNCMITSGDPYQPICHDNIVISILLILLLIAIVIIILRYIKCQRLKQKKCGNRLSTIYKEKLEDHIKKYEAYIVKSSALEIISPGEFSSKHLAILHTGGLARTVVVKTVCSHQTDSGVLREAGFLTALKHEHIIRLVGVCFDSERPLVLLENVFFGDLLQYLQSRRFLLEDKVSSEGSNLNGESVHISSKALTKLALEAASALEHLTICGVVHRDLRASNCLIDTNRSLKLTGFCMATNASNAKSDTEIPCMERGLMSVQSMAPECFHGAFSAASDIWAFGVLVFELVTLGANPYGNMSSSKIKEFVIAGGTPLLPVNASPLTQELVQKCWRRSPEQRVTAAGLVECLTREPTTLSPALECEEYRSLIL